MKNMMVKPVRIYQDLGSSEVGVASLLAACPTKLQRPVAPISAQQIRAGELQDACALIMPGGADLPYCAQLNGEGNRQIRTFVEQGGCYVGICAGAYYACREVDFQGADYRVSGARELAFFDGVAKGSLVHLTEGRYYDETVASKAWVPLWQNHQPLGEFYYHGGGTFLADQPGQNMPYFATFADGLPAIIQGQVGLGNYLFSAVHFELQFTPYAQLVVANAPSEVYHLEQRFLAGFSPDYGAPVWREIQRLLNSDS